MKKVSLISFLLMVVFLLVLSSCGNQASDQNQAQSEGFMNGEYSAEFSHVDGHGWKPVLKIVVADSKIVQVDFDYLNPKGEKKSEDQAYQARMSKIAGIGPMDYIPKIEQAAVEKQDSPIDVVTGATSSTENFNQLFVAVLANAKAGMTDAVVLPMNDTYTAEDAVDERGFVGTIAVTYTDGKISSVVYDEVKKAADGKVESKKSDDAAYNEGWAKKHPGISGADVYTKLAASLVEKQDPAVVDAVSGATSGSSRFKALAAVAIAKRQ